MNIEEIHGSCLCGGIQYSLTQKPIEILNCHCKMCRKSNGCAYATWAGVYRDHLVLRDEGDILQKYQSSKEVTRSFCKRCGSALFFDHEKDALIWATVGTIDTDEEDLAATTHIYVGSKAPWHTIVDDLPRFETVDAEYGHSLEQE